MTSPILYASVDELKAYSLPKAKESSVDNKVLQAILTSASRKIDAIANQKFYPDAADTAYYYDTPGFPHNPLVYTTPQIVADTLIFDVPMISVTSITNGDGSVIDPARYILRPINSSPKQEVQLRMMGGISWLTNNGDPLGAITVLGIAGFSAQVLDDIREACLLIAKATYNRRYGENATGKSIITAAGVIVSPEDIPDEAMRIILSHRRTAFG